MSSSGLEPPELARLFALGANDARTPLATLRGYGRTLSRELAGSDAAAYVSTIQDSAREIEEIVERLALVARIQEGRYTPALSEVAAADLAQAAVSALGAERVELRGGGGDVAVVDRSVVEDALTTCARAAMRHGAIDKVVIELSGTTLSYRPIRENARRVLSGEEMREFGVGAALLVLKALGCETSMDGDSFVVVLPKQLR